jgi:hypothetical protein
VDEWFFAFKQLPEKFLSFRGKFEWAIILRIKWLLKNNRGTNEHRRFYRMEFSEHVHVITTEQQCPAANFFPYSVNSSV